MCRSDQLYSICDLFFDAVYYASGQKQQGADATGRMNLAAFHHFLGTVCSWADLEQDRLKRRTRGIDNNGQDVAGRQIIVHLFHYFNREVVS
jgi:hypothetical protein